MWVAHAQRAMLGRAKVAHVPELFAGTRAHYVALLQVIEAVKRKGPNLCNVVGQNAGLPFFSHGRICRGFAQGH